MGISSLQCKMVGWGRGQRGRGERGEINFFHVEVKGLAMQFLGDLSDDRDKRIRLRHNWFSLCLALAHLIPAP